jgi:hypothetical protein
MVFPVAFTHPVLGIVWNHFVVSPFLLEGLRPGIATRVLAGGFVQQFS